MAQKQLPEQEEERTAYLCGWALALLEEAGIVHNIGSLYTQASQQPIRYLGPLFARLYPRDQERTRLVDEAMIEVMGQIRQFPVKLSLAEQGLFALGYWQHHGRIDVSFRVTEQEYRRLDPWLQQEQLSEQLARRARTMTRAEVLSSEQDRTVKQERLTRVMTVDVPRSLVHHAEQLQVKTSTLLRASAHDLVTHEEATPEGEEKRRVHAPERDAMTNQTPEPEKTEADELLEIIDDPEFDGR